MCVCVYARMDVSGAIACGVSDKLQIKNFLIIIFRNEISMVRDYYYHRFEEAFREHLFFPVFDSNTYMLKKSFKNLNAT